MDMRPDSPNSQAQLLTREEAAVFLGVSIATLNRYIKNGSVQPIRVGKFLRFDKDYLTGGPLIKALDGRQDASSQPSL